MNFKEKIKQNKWNIIITLIYAIVTFIITIFFHEKWRDEAQAWLIARDLDIFGIIKQMSYEGHPPLWHLILAPFAKLGFPYITESIISWAIMVITVWILVNKSPFNNETKILIILTSPFIYLYPSISRNYCLIPLALALIAMYYPKRKEKMLGYCLSVLLLAYTHVLMLAMAGLLYLFYFIDEIFYIKKTKEEKEKLIKVLAISAIGLVCLFLILVGSTSKNTQIPLNSEHNMINATRVKLLFTSMQGKLFGIIVNSIGFKVYFYAFIILLIIWQARKNVENLIITVFSIFWQIYIYLFINNADGQKTCILILIFIFIAWINHYKESEKNNSKKIEIWNNIIKKGILVLLILNSMVGINEISLEVEKIYSNAKFTANFINANTEKDSILVCANPSTMSAIIPYTHNRKFWNPTSEEFFTYITWNKAAITYLNVDEIIEKTKKVFNAKDNIYFIISNKHIGIQETNITKLQKENLLSKNIYKDSDNTVLRDENFTIYKINLQEK